MLRVGLTGGLGSGKTTVAGIFEQLGAAVIAADQLGRQLMQPGEPVYAAIVQTFGLAVVSRRWFARSQGAGRSGAFSIIEPARSTTSCIPPWWLRKRNGCAVSSPPIRSASRW